MKAFPAAALAVLLLSGCLGPDVEIEFAGRGSGDELRTLQCDGDGRVEADVAGSGEVLIAVSDGAGEEVYRRGGSGSHLGGQEERVAGEPGVWRLNVTWTDFDGVLEVGLSC